MEFKVGDLVEYPSGEGRIMLPPDNGGVVVVDEEGSYKRVHKTALTSAISKHQKSIEYIAEVLRNYYTVTNSYVHDLSSFVPMAKKINDKVLEIHNAD